MGINFNPEIVGSTPSVAPEPSVAPNGEAKPKKVSDRSIFVEGKDMPEMNGVVLGFASERQLVNGSKGNVNAFYKVGVGNMASTEGGINAELPLVNFKKGKYSLSLTGETGVYGNISFTQKYAGSTDETGTAETPATRNQPSMGSGGHSFMPGGHFGIQAQPVEGEATVANNFGAFTNGGLKFNAHTRGADISATLGGEIGINGRFLKDENSEVVPQVELNLSPKAEIGVEFGKERKNGVDLSASGRGAEITVKRKF